MMCQKSRQKKGTMRHPEGVQSLQNGAGTCLGLHASYVSRESLSSRGIRKDLQLSQTAPQVFSQIYRKCGSWSRSGRGHGVKCEDSSRLSKQTISCGRITQMIIPSVLRMLPVKGVDVSKSKSMPNSALIRNKYQ